jgi:hypothetical protein
MFFNHILLALGGTVTLAHAANSWIVPGTEWKSTTGKAIDAHGGMVVQDGDTFYWIGQAVSDRESLTTEHTFRAYMLTKAEIQPYLYSSKNLLDWEPAKTPMASTKFMWRPKLAKPNGSWWVSFASNNFTSFYHDRMFPVSPPYQRLTILTRSTAKSTAMSKH